jgi:hypothetical protein
MGAQFGRYWPTVDIVPAADPLGVFVFVVQLSAVPALSLHAIDLAILRRRWA